MTKKKYLSIVTHVFFPSGVIRFISSVLAFKLYIALFYTHILSSAPDSHVSVVEVLGC